MKRFSLMILPILLLTACKTTDGGAGTAVTPDGTLLNTSNSPKGWVTANTKFGKFTGYNQNASYYGAWVDDSGQYRTLNYQGTPATNIPTTGRATYLGNAVRVENGTVKNVGTSRVNVDFGYKTVDGKLAMDGLRRDVTLHKTKLNGATFEGQASVLLNDGGTYKGALMGNGATEVVGLVEFKNNSNLDTAFGGINHNK